MWRRKQSAVISNSSGSPRPCQAALDAPAAEDLVLRLGRRERAEVVLAEQELGRVGEPRLVERARQPPAAAPLERGRRPAPLDPVAVRARARRVARVEVGRRLCAGDDGHVVRQRGVQRLGRAAPAAARRRRRRSPRGRARARRRPCGRRRRGPSTRAKRPPSASRSVALDRAQPGLRRPAARSRCRRTRG